MREQVLAELTDDEMLRLPGFQAPGQGVQG